MSGGLVALLDDVAAIARIAAASIDDIGAAASKAGMKAVGVVVDDTAVTPRYVTGFSPDRELPIIWRIALGSLRNKLLFILPAILLMSQFLPWLITPLLMAGAVYLCFEGAEKLAEMFGGHHDEGAEDTATLSSKEHEEKMVAGAIRTDFILSAEIMVISLAEVADQGLVMRAVILIVVALLITALVYGVVALIVKMDDLGLKLARNGRTSGGRALGSSMVKAMPRVLSFLSSLGTAAMLWVGGHIVLDGLKKFGWKAPAEALHETALWAGSKLHAIHGFAEWFVETLGSGLVGMLIGGVIVNVLHLLHRNEAPAH